MAVSGQGGGGAKFMAKRVPDFAKLHALEDARVARWKKQNKRDVTVALGVRLPLESQLDPLLTSSLDRHSSHKTLIPGDIGQRRALIADINASSSDLVRLLMLMCAPPSPNTPEKKPQRHSPNLPSRTTSSASMPRRSPAATTPPSPAPPP